MARVRAVVRLVVVRQLDSVHDVRDGATFAGAVTAGGATVGHRKAAVHAEANGALAARRRAFAEDGQADGRDAVRQDDLLGQPDDTDVVQIRPGTELARLVIGMDDDVSRINVLGA